MEEYYYTINGNRWVVLDGQTFADFVEMEWQLKGYWQTAAFLYLKTLGFSEEEAEEYLSGLLPKENCNG